MRIGPDIIISVKGKIAIVSAVTHKGQEWLLLNADHDTPTIPRRDIYSTAYLMELDGVLVEIIH